MVLSTPFLDPNSPLKCRRMEREKVKLFRVCLLFCPRPGPLASCCGKSSLWATCRTPAKATRRFWSSSPAEDGWTHLRTAPGLCMTPLGTFVLVTEQFLLSEIIWSYTALFNIKGQMAASFNKPQDRTSKRGVKSSSPSSNAAFQKRHPPSGWRL